MRPILRFAFLAVLGCAPAATQQDLPSPADIPRLRQTVLSDSSDLGARVGLAVALRESGQAAEARQILERVVADRPADPGPVLLLGLTCEETGDWGCAREAYTRYLELARSAALRQTIQRRLRYVHRNELEVQVRASLAREAELTATEPDGRAVAVFPFLFQSADTTLRPLSRALAQLLATDLSQTDRLRILERVHVQLLLDEIELGERGLVDPATAAQSGRLLRAGNVVQGTIEGEEEQVRLGAVVVGVGRDSVASHAPLTEEDPLERLFDMEERLALGLYSSMGIELTVAEAERVRRRPTANVQALLAFGRGLEAEDRGDWAEAARQYARALALDPAFGPAQERADEVSAISEAEGTTVEVLIETGVDVENVPVVPDAETTTLGEIPSPTPGSPIGPGPGDVLSPDPIRGILPDPFQRDSGSEVLGQEGIGARTLLRIIFHRPNG